MMKKNFQLFLLGLVLLLGACSKDKQDAPVKGKRIAAVFVDNVLLERYSYRSDGKLDKYNSYKPDGSPERYWQYNYDGAGVLSSVKSYLADGTPKTELVLMKDASGRIERSRFINYGIFAQDSKYEYDDAVPSRVKRIRDYDTLGTPTLVREYTYNAGLVATGKVFEVNGAALELMSEYHFTAAADPGVLARHLETVSSLTDPTPDNWLVYAVNSQVAFTSYLGGLVNYDWVYECLGRVTDERKYTLSVDYKIKYLKPAQPDKLTTFRYEYVDL
jgi:hypothetical protein